MQEIIKYLKNLNKRVKISATIMKKNVEGKITYDVEAKKTDKQGFTVRTEFTITKKSKLKTVKKRIEIPV